MPFHLNDTLKQLTISSKWRRVCIFLVIKKCPHRREFGPLIMLDGAIVNGRIELSFFTNFYRPCYTFVNVNEVHLANVR